MHSAESTAWSHRAPTPSVKVGLKAQIARGLHLAAASLRALSKDPQLLALPFLALVLTGFVWLVVALSFWGLGFPPGSPNSSFLYQEMFVAYLGSYFLSIYFMAAILGAAHARIEGRRPTISDGFRAANSALLRLLAWSLFAATIGVLLRLASLRWEQAGRIQARILGNPWPIASLFVLPTIVLEGLGPVKAFGRSRTIVRERWGSNPSGVLGTGVVFLLLFVVGLVPFLYGLLGDASAFWEACAVFYWLALAALWSVVHGILVTTLYHYATASSAAFNFNWQALNHPWVR
jgi:hypothetical protein